MKWNETKSFYDSLEIEHKKQKVIENKKNKDNIENKKVNKVDEYSQVYKKNDFKDKPPKLPQLYFRDYLYENKNIFSNLNGSIGDININKNVKNSFYNHLMINKNDNKSNYLITSVNRRVCAKLFTYIYYSPWLVKIFVILFINVLKE